LPARGRFGSPNSMRAAEKMGIFDDVAALVNSRERVAKLKIHVRQKAMLRVTRADADGAGISFLNVKVHICERGIKCSRIGVRNLFAGISRTATSEIKDDFLPRWIPEAGGIFRQNNCWPFDAIADEPDCRPDVNRVADSIISRREKDNSLPG